MEAKRALTVFSRASVLTLEIVTVVGALSAVVSRLARAEEATPHCYTAPTPLHHHKRK